MTEMIKIRGVEIGRRTPAGNYLLLASWRALRDGERVAAYLALVWPATRHAGTIERVCGLRRGTLSAVSKTLIQHGALRRLERGRYMLDRRLPTREEPACSTS